MASVPWNVLWGYAVLVKGDVIAVRALSCLRWVLAKRWSSGILGRGALRGLPKLLCCCGNLSLAQDHAVCPEDTVTHLPDLL